MSEIYFIQVESNSGAGVVKSAPTLAEARQVARALMASYDTRSRAWANILVSGHDGMIMVDHIKAS